MKRILFVAGSLRIGGIARSLTNLFHCIDLTQYEVDLFLFSNSGEYLETLPPKIRLVNHSWWLNCVGLSHQEAWNTGNLMIIAVRTILAILCKRVGSKKVFSMIFSLIRPIGPYDIAISYSHNNDLRTLYFGYNQFVLKRVLADKKVAWIHSDYQRAGFNHPVNNEEYRQFNAIVNVSWAGKKIFEQFLPEFKAYSFVVNNMFPVETIQKYVDLAPNPYEKTIGLTIVSVGRLDSNKSLDRVIWAAARLRDKGYPFRWFIVGDGPRKTALQKLTVQLNLQEYVHFTGYQSNPYPYIKYADLLVLTSKYEGMPMVVSEALILGTPVVVTEYAAAREQVKEGYNGFIVENSEEEIMNGVERFFVKSGLSEELKRNLVNEHFSNETALRQFEHVMNTIE